jgi:hypothetical protein
MEGEGKEKRKEIEIMNAIRKQNSSYFTMSLSLSLMT